MGRYILSLCAALLFVFTLPEKSDKVLVRASNLHGVDHRDAEGLTLLIEAFPSLGSTISNPNPCLEDKVWSWVECNQDNPPRITTLYLKGYNLHGEIPNFNSMDALETIDMRHNYIYEAIPVFVGDLPHLNRLALSNNKLSGRIPSSLEKNSQIILDVTGNDKLCSSSDTCTIDSNASSMDSEYLPTSNGGKSNIMLATTLVVIISPALFLFVLSGIRLLLHQRNKFAILVMIAAVKGSSTSLLDTFRRADPFPCSRCPPCGDRWFWFDVYSDDIHPTTVVEVEEETRHQ